MHSVSDNRLPNDRASDSATGVVPQSLKSTPAQVARPAAPSAAQLLVIWQETLGAPEAGTAADVDENFFDAGGTSLLAARLAARIKAQLGCAVTAGDILAHPSVRALAKKLAGGEAGVDRAASDRRAVLQRTAFKNPRLRTKTAAGK